MSCGEPPYWQRQQTNNGSPYDGKWTCKECKEVIEDGIDGVGVFDGRGVGICRRCAPAYLKGFIELAKIGAFDYLLNEDQAVMAPPLWTYMWSVGKLIATSKVIFEESTGASNSNKEI